MWYKHEKKTVSTSGSTSFPKSLATKAYWKFHQHVLIASGLSRFEVKQAEMIILIRLIIVLGQFFWQNKNNVVLYHEHGIMNFVNKISDSQQ